MMGLQFVTLFAIIWIARRNPATGEISLRRNQEWRKCTRG
jgi:hypothetical protein